MGSVVALQQLFTQISLPVDSASDKWQFHLNIAHSCIALCFSLFGSPSRLALKVNNDFSESIGLGYSLSTCFRDSSIGDTRTREIYINDSERKEARTLVQPLVSSRQEPHNIDRFEAEQGDKQAASVSSDCKLSRYGSLPFHRTSCRPSIFQFHFKRHLPIVDCKIQIH